MIERIDLGEPNVLAYELHGKMTNEDVERVHDDLRAAISTHDNVCMYTDVTDLEGMEPSAVLKDLKLTPEYVSDVDRYAVVGQQRWHELATKLGEAITSGEARFFGPDEKQQAREWVR